MILGNINLSVSTVIPYKRPVSQLFRNFDLNYSECFAHKLNSRIELSYRYTKLCDLVMNCFER